MLSSRGRGDALVPNAREDPPPTPRPTNSAADGRNTHFVRAFWRLPASRTLIGGPETASPELALGAWQPICDDVAHARRRRSSNTLRNGPFQFPELPAPDCAGTGRGAW